MGEDEVPLISPFEKDEEAIPYLLRHLFPVVALESLGIAVMVPFMPEVINQFFNEDQRLVYWVFGGSVAVSAFLTFISAPIWGRLSDSIGRKPFILIAFASSQLHYIVLTFDLSLWFFFALMPIIGAVAVGLALYSSYVADIIHDPHRRHVAFGQVLGLVAIGSLVGIIIGGALPFHLAKWIPFVVMVVGTIYVIVLLPESLDQNHRVDFSWDGTNPLKNLAVLNLTPVVRTVGALTLFAATAHYGVQDTLLFYLRRRGFTHDRLAIFVGLILCGMALTQILLLPLLLKFMTPRKILFFALSVCSAVAVSWGLLTQTWQFYFLAMIASFGLLIFPVSTGLIANEGKRDTQGLLQGSFVGLNKLGMGLGPLIFNSIAGATNGKPVDFPMAPFLLASLIYMFAMVLAYHLSVNIAPTIIESQEAKKLQA